MHVHVAVNFMFVRQQIVMVPNYLPRAEPNNLDSTLYCLYVWATPLDSEAVWTVHCWLKTVFLKLQN